MSTPDSPELIAPDRGLDATTTAYPLVVRAVLLAPLQDAPGGLPDEATQLAARTVAALNEVARWANDGQSADPTACAWLGYLRWAVANGARLPSDAPHPPADDFDRDHPLLARPGEHTGDSFAALATGALGEVVRPVLPRAGSPEVLARTAPYGLLPTVGWKSLVALAVDSAAITHGSPESQTAAVAMALAVHAAARAAEIGASLTEVVAETARVCGLVTRPAPDTLDLLTRCADPAAREELLDAAAAGTAAPEPELAASYALALGLAALLAAEGESGNREENDVARRALGRLPGSGPAARAARTAAVTVAAARWPHHGTEGAEDRSGAGHGHDATRSGARDARAELEELAAEWNARWRP